MGSNTADEKKIHGRKLFIVILSVLAVAAAFIFVFFFRSKIRATTIRILSLEGNVSLEDNGVEKPVSERLRLTDGNALNTEKESYVSLGLDESKTVTLNEKSRAVFTQLGKKLDMSLTQGSLFFDVSKPLKDDETFNIRTSTMVVGIRGTSGLVTNKDGNEELIITEGHVHVTGKNPVTGEIKEIEVYAGQKIVIYLYNDRKIDSIEFKLTKVTERDLPEFVLRYLREHPDTLDKVITATLWDKAWILGGAGRETESKDNKVMQPAKTDNNDNGSDGNDGGSSEQDDTGDTDEETEDGNAIPGTVNAEGTVDGNAALGNTILTSAQLAEARSAMVFTNTGNGAVLLADGTLFDPAYYAAANPEVVAVYGSSTEALVYHYIHSGRTQGRSPVDPAVVTAKAAESIVHFDPNANIENSSSSSDDDDDDDDDKDDSSGSGSTSPANTTPPGPAPATTGTVDGNDNIIVNGTTIGHLTNGGQRVMVVTTGNQIDLPLEITDTSGNITTVSSLTEIDFPGSLGVYSWVKDTVTGIQVMCTSTSTSATATKIYRISKGSYQEDNINDNNIYTKINEFYAMP